MLWERDPHTHIHIYTYIHAYIHTHTHTDSDALILPVDPRAEDSVLGEHKMAVSHPGIPRCSQPLSEEGALSHFGTSESCVH